MSQSGHSGYSNPLIRSAKAAPINSIALAQREKFIKQLETFRDRLLRVDWRNRAILLRKIHARWSFDLVELGHELALEVVGKAFIARGSVCLVLDSDLSEEAEARRHQLRSLARTEDLLEQESGLRDLFVGFPFLQGHLSPEHYIRGPLVLFPGKLEHRRGIRASGWYITFPEGEVPVWNRALLAAGHRIAGFSTSPSPQEELDMVLEQLAQDRELGSVKLLPMLAEMLRSWGWPLNDQPLPESVRLVETITLEHIQALTREPLRTEPYIVLGNFPQGSSAIFQDYEELIERARAGETDQGIIDNLLEAPADEYRPTPPLYGEDNRDALDNVPAHELNNVLPSDASQDAVIVEAQQAPCIVVRGPPGTGKSQVIVNLISTALTKGESVALVCQKRAALDVVHQRLDRAGLGRYAVLVHDPRGDLRDTYARLRTLLDTQVPRIENVSERLDRASRNIDQTIRELNAIAKALWLQYFGGLRVRDLYLALDPTYTPRMKLNEFERKLDYASLTQFLEELPIIESEWKKYAVPTHPLWQRASFAALGHQDRINLVALLQTSLALSKKEYQLLQNVAAHDTVIQQLQAFLVYHRRFLRWLFPRWRRLGRKGAAFLLSRGEKLEAGPANRWIELLTNGRELLVSLRALAPYFTEQGLAEFLRDGADAQRLGERLKRTTAAIDEWDAIQAHDARRARLSGPETELLRLCGEQLQAVDGWAQALRQEILFRWADIVEEKHPQLRGDPLAKYMELRTRLERHLEDKRRLVIQKLTYDLETRAKTPVLPPGTYHGNRDPRTDWNKLRHEFSKRRRLKPLRQLFEEFAFQLSRIAPCWLMSPEAFSGVFPLKRSLFDLIIFDEASQLAVERALPALYRGKRIVIAGDEKQLRPFDLFIIHDEEEIEDEDDSVGEVLTSESLLVLAKRIYGFRYLSWHYRSHYEELIDFSNHAFYDGQLRIPCNIHRTPPVIPIQWIRCDGIWEHRRNLVEASRVADLIFELLQEGERRGVVPSVGIVTFNEPQREAILDEIDRRRDGDPEFERLMQLAENPPSGNPDDKLFVKNIENVQGDERDVIVFSVGYARDHEGKFRVHFGLLNQEGGENRLNVAVTRARRRVIIVCSFDPRELKVEHTTHAGPKRLKQYLLYGHAVNAQIRKEVERVLEELNPGFVRSASAIEHVFESPLEQAVHDTLEQFGYEVDSQVGYSGYRIDLAVVHPRDPSRYILAIECDGATFHSAAGARERDVYRQRFLQDRGWALERIWSRNWWRNRSGELQRLQRRIEELAVGAPPPITRE